MRNDFQNKARNFAKGGKITPMPFAKGEKPEEAKKPKGFAAGGSIDGIAKRGKTRGKMC